MITNIKSSRHGQYEQKPMTQAEENSQIKGFTHTDRVNTRYKAENIYFSHFRRTSFN